MNDYTQIYNRLVQLHYKTKNPTLEKKCMGKIFEILYKAVPIVYYSYVQKKHIFRSDNDDMIEGIILRISTRVDKWKRKEKGCYTVVSLTSLIYLEAVYFLHNAKQQFYDDMDSLDELNDKTRRIEDVQEDEMD